MRDVNPRACTAVLGLKSGFKLCLSVGANVCKRERLHKLRSVFLHAEASPDEHVEVLFALLYDSNTSSIKSKKNNHFFFV